MDNFMENSVNDVYETPAHKTTYLNLQEISHNKAPGLNWSLKATEYHTRMASARLSLENLV